ncbi:hypothetical protein L0244_32890 [bacterium]|nr:hypothetical protein [bacterium]
MKYAYVVMECDEIVFITLNFDVAIMYWLMQREELFGHRPDIFKWELGLSGRYEYITDEAAQTYIAANISVNECSADKNIQDNADFFYTKHYFRILPIDDLLSVLYQRIEQLKEYNG